LERRRRKKGKKGEESSSEDLEIDESFESMLARAK
jgi:hypothetical protein